LRSSTAMKSTLGGFSLDDHSWVDHIKVTVPAGTFTATDTAPWAYTWDLPDQGNVDVTAVAYDAVGNASAPVTIQVTVDSLSRSRSREFAARRRGNERENDQQAAPRSHFFLPNRRQPSSGSGYPVDDQRRVMNRGNTAGQIALQRTSAVEHN